MIMRGLNNIEPSSLHGALVSQDRSCYVARAEVAFG
jgi:hypothetical protein